jgi:hypothetical protein
MNCKDSESWQIIRNVFEKYEPGVSIIFHFTDGCSLLKLSALYIIVDFFHFNSRSRVWLFNGAIVIVGRMNWKIIVNGELVMILTDASVAKLKVLFRHLSEETEETYRIVKSGLGTYWVACSLPVTQHGIDTVRHAYTGPFLARTERIAAENLRFVHQL